MERREYCELMEMLKRVAEATEKIAAKLPEPRPTGKTSKVTPINASPSARPPLRSVRSDESKK